MGSADDTALLIPLTLCIVGFAAFAVVWMRGWLSIEPAFRLYICRCRHTFAATCVERQPGQIS